jgi:aminoglycoside phosphotransferase (APT) family kinase protein
VALRLGGPCAGGEVGAYHAEDERGRRVVVKWRDDVGHTLVDEVLGIGGLQSGAAGVPGGWADYMRMTLTEGADGYCLHEPLRRHSPETRRLLEWVESVGRGIGRLPDVDLVHVDFHHRNMLRGGDRLTAVVDWEGCRAGDRAFDLVTFCFGMTDAVQEAGVEERVWAAACGLAGAELLAPYVAHMALRRVDWSIRHHPEEVDHVLGLALRYAGYVAD